MNRKKFMSLLLTAAVGAAILAPTTAMAEETTTWDAPTEAMAVDDSIAKVGIHAAASTTSFFLGGNVVAERASDYRSITSAATAEDKYQAAMAFTRLGAFGSSSNISPDPYLWNYFYNLALDAGHATGTTSEDGVYISAGAGSPMSADTTMVDDLGTSYTLARRPDVLMGISAMGTNPTYDEMIAQLPENNDEDTTNDYNPIQIPYKANNFADLVSDMYDLSDAMKESGKDGRYGDTEAIAQNYEAYMKGLQYYILEQIDNGDLEMKEVAVITEGVDTDDDGLNDTYTCVSNTDVIGTSTDRPAESIMYTAVNLKDTVGETATLQQIADTDAVIFGGHVTGEADNLIKAMKAADIAEEDIPPIYDADPSDVFTIRANSVENFVGVAIFNGFLYPEVINPVDATMYVYENFWHLDESKLATFAQANFAQASLPEGIKADGSTYDESEIDDMIVEGLKYARTVEDEYAGTTLELTSHLDGYEEEPHVNEWVKDESGEWYYYDASGNIMTNDWAKDSKGWCWMGSDGKITKSKWIQDNGEWYYLKANGYMAANEWAKDSGGWFYMNGSGKIAKNTWAKDSKGWMYLNANGRITTSKWIKDGSEWYYLKANGYMAANEWTKDSTGWMYMNGSGKITKSKWIKDGNDWYYLKANGYMAANEWAQDSTNWYWMGSNGKIASTQKK